jgi:hypothetical protein
MRVEAFVTVNVKVMVLCDVMLCSSVDTYHQF